MRMAYKLFLGPGFVFKLARLSFSNAQIFEFRDMLEKSVMFAINAIFVPLPKQK